MGQDRLTASKWSINTAARPLDSIRPRWVKMRSIPQSTELSEQRIEQNAEICARGFSPGRLSIPIVALSTMNEVIAP